MNKGVSIAGGVILALSLLLTVGGGAISGEAGGNLEKINDDPSPYYTSSEGGNTTFTYIDADRKGSVGFEVLISLDYVDIDKDGFVDECSDYEVKVIDENGTDVTTDVINRGCIFNEWTEEDQMHEGLVLSSYVCETLYLEAKCNLNSRYTVSVTDSNNESVDFILFDNDAYSIVLLEALGDDLGGLVGGLGLISVGCCGIVIGLIILIIGLALSGPQTQPQMMMQQHMASTMPMNQIGTPAPLQVPVQNMQPPLSSDATGSSVPDMAAAYAGQFNQPPTE